MNHGLVHGQPPPGILTPSSNGIKEQPPLSTVVHNLSESVFGSSI